MSIVGIYYAANELLVAQTVEYLNYVTHFLSHSHTYIRTKTNNQTNKYTKYDNKERDPMTIVSTKTNYDA